MFSDCACTVKGIDLIPFDLLYLAITLANSDLTLALSRLIKSLIFFHNHFVCSIFNFHWVYMYLPAGFSHYSIPNPPHSELVVPKKPIVKRLENRSIGKF